MQYKRYFAATLRWFAIASLAIAVIPLAQFLPEAAHTVVTIIIALVFWGSVILGAVSVRRTNKRFITVRKRLSANGQTYQKRPIGIINFSGKRTSLIVYSVFLLGVCLIILDIIFHFISEFIMFPVIAITFFAFVVHCVIDGNDYRTYEIVKEGLNNDNK